MTAASLMTLPAAVESVKAGRIARACKPGHWRVFRSDGATLIEIFDSSEGTAR